MTHDLTTAESRLLAAAQRLYGDEWARPLSSLTGIALRTCQRVHANIKAGLPDERAAGVLNELTARLAEISAAADGLGEALEDRINASDGGLHDLYRAFSSRLRGVIAKGRPSVSVSGNDLALLLEWASEVETELARLLHTGTLVTTENPSERQWADFYSAVENAMWRVNMPGVIDSQGDWHLLAPASSVFGAEMVSTFYSVAHMSHPSCVVFTVRDGAHNAFVDAVAADPAVRHILQFDDTSDTIKGIDGGGGICAFLLAGTDFDDAKRVMEAGLKWPGVTASHVLNPRAAVER